MGDASGGEDALDREDVKHGELLGAWARERRAQLRLTAEQIVARMGPGVPQNYVTSLENGGRKRMISQPRLGQLVRALEATEVDALRGAGLITDQAEPAGADMLSGEERELVGLYRQADADGRRYVRRIARLEAQEAERAAASPRAPRG